MNWLVPDATVEEMDDYISKTVHGKITDGNNDTNRLFQAKRRLDMTVKMWTEDLREGLVMHTELTDGSPFIDRVMNGILKKLPSGISSDPYLFVGMKLLEQTKKKTSN